MTAVNDTHRPDPVRYAAAVSPSPTCTVRMSRPAAPAAIIGAELLVQNKAREASLDPAKAYSLGSMAANLEAA